MHHVSSGVATSDSHVIHWHDTGGKLLGAELDAIAQATKEILLEQYIFRPSPIGERFRDELTAAARRGVRVTVLLDHVGSMDLPKTYLDEMSASGGKVIWFNPVHWRFWSFRDHRKLLVVDRKQAFTGGCNIAQEYDGDGIHEGWRDGGVAITGPVVGELIKSFDDQVAIADNKIWRMPKTGRHGQIKTGEDVSLLLTRPGFRDVFQRVLQADLLQARDVAITSAYFLPVARLKKMLLRAARCADVFRLLLPGKSDVPMMQVASRALYGRFQRRGAQIHEYQAQILHAKIIIVDDIVYIGSSNLDPRSININFEVMLRIRSASLAQQARVTFERDLRHSQWVAKLSWHKPASWWQRLKQKLARMFFVQFDLGIAQFFADKVERRGS